MRLDLGPVALAFIGTPDGMTPDKLRPAVEMLAELERAEKGEYWPSAWLRNVGVSVPAGEAAEQSIRRSDAGQFGCDPLDARNAGHGRQLVHELAPEPAPRSQEDYNEESYSYAETL